MKRLMVSIVVVLVALSSSGAVMADVWMKTYGGSGSERASVVQQTMDGGYIVAGSIDSSGAGSTDGWISKLDVSGNIEWQKTYGGNGGEEIASIQQTLDGGFIAAGSTTSSGTGGKDIWVSRLDSNGQIEWQNTYGGVNDDEASTIVQTADGKYVLAGTSNPGGTRKKDLVVMKLDQDGKIEWQKTYGGDGDDVVHTIQPISNGQYILAGSTDSYGVGKKDAWVLKLNQDGEIVWQKTYGALGDDEAYSIYGSSDGGCIVAGWTNSYAGLKIEAWVLKLDEDGIVTWQRTYGGSGDDRAYAVAETSEGKYVVAGSTDSYGAGKKDAWILKLDNNGNIFWQQTFGGAGDDEFFSVQETLDGGYVAAGRSDSFGGGGDEALLIKFDSDGNISGCQVISPSYASIRQTVVSGVSVGSSSQVATLSSQPGTLILSLGGAVPSSVCMVQEPEISVDPISLDFGAVVRGASSSQTVAVENVGSMDLVVGTIDITGTNHIDFGIRKDSCSGQTLKPLAQCSVEVSFSPGGSGSRGAGLSIPSNDSDFRALSVSLEGNGVAPISLTEPPDHASFSSCSLYDLPTFAWDVEGSFKSYEIQFSNVQDFNSSSKSVKVKTTLNEALIKANAWKQIMLIPTGPGGPVYWRVLGVFTGGKSGFVSEARTITIEPSQSVKNAQIGSTNKNSLPILSWENNCNVKFKVWFGKDVQFSKKYSIPYTIKNPSSGDGNLNQTLTSQQWNSVKKLVGGQSGVSIYWKVESWDGANRESQTILKSFTLQE